MPARPYRHVVRPSRQPSVPPDPADAPAPDLAERRAAWLAEFYVVTGGPDVALDVPAEGTTLDDVLAEIQAAHADRAESGGFDGDDLAVWHAGRLLAVVRGGAGGRVEVTRFDGQAAPREMPSRRKARNCAEGPGLFD